MNIATYVPVAEVEYPEDDGLPMSDNSRQFLFVVYLFSVLSNFFKKDEETLVAGNLLWYPVEGNNLIRTAPDVFVVKGRPKGVRGSYLQWREDGIPPQVVWEVLSPGNRAGEMQLKLEFYERYGVSEYYLYDPHHGTLRGWQREGEELVEIKRMQGWVSPLLKVRLELHDQELVLFGPDNARLLTYEESEDGRHEALARAEAEQLAREQAEAATERERAARAEAEAQAERERTARAEAEAQAERERAARADAEAQAERERTARADAEALTARLAEKLRQLGINLEQ